MTALALALVGSNSSIGSHCRSMVRQSRTTYHTGLIVAYQPAGLCARACAGVRLYAVTIDDYVPSQANPQQDGGGCDGWLRDAVAEREEVREPVQALKSEL